MEYKVYKLSFPNGVHFGNTLLTDSDFILHADTIFSAMCNEAIKIDGEGIERLVSYVQDDRLLISDMLPYIGKSFYVPKPVVKLEVESQGDSVVKKAYKKLSYIPSEAISTYVSGNLDVISEKEVFSRLGFSETRTLAAVSQDDNALPYQVGVYHFSKGNGLYLIVGYDGDDVYNYVESLLEMLSFSGLGGKRSAGLGRFDFKSAYMDEEFKTRLSREGEKYMSLSVSLPGDDEIDSVIETASYKMIKRSGYVYSYGYADEYMRKKDIYLFNSGSCCTQKYRGGIYDVAGAKGKHPVYRYAKPMFMEVGV